MASRDTMECQGTDLTFSPATPVEQKFQEDNSSNFSAKNINEYVSAICQQIRWKKARLRVSEEMTAHITDGRDAYIRQGVDEAAATKKALLDTGDSAELGLGFDRIHRPRPQWGMLAAVVVFLAIGILATLAMHDNWGMPGRLMVTAVGVAVMLAAYFMDFTLLGKYPKTVFFGIIAFSLMLIISSSIHMLWRGFVSVLWIFSTPLALRQAFSLLFPLAFVACVYALRNKGIAGVALSSMAYVVLSGFALTIALTTGMFHFMVVGMVVFIITLLRDWFGIQRVLRISIVSISLAAFFGFSAFLAISPSAAGMRVSTALNPMLDPLGFGFQAMQIRNVLSDAVLFGQGAGSTAFLPDARFNLVLTSVIHYYGWAMFAAIVGALLGFIAFGFWRCFKQKSGLGFLVSFAIMATFALQVFTYVIFNLGVTITQISLPLISPGNSAMLVNMGLIGFMLSVFRTGDVVVERTHQQDAGPGIFSWEDGKLTIDFSHFKSE